MESLEFERVAARIEEEEGRLFAGQAFEADAGLDDELGVSRDKFRRQPLPFFHRQDCSEMAHRNCVTVNVIMFFVSDLVRA